MDVRPALCAVVAALAAGPALAQVAGTDLVPPYTATAVTRSAGYVPISPPIRTGVTYAVRAVDPYGLRVLVAVDGRTGEVVSIRRIAAPMPPPYPYAAPTYRYGAYAPDRYRPLPYRYGAISVDRYDDPPVTPPRPVPTGPSPSASGRSVPPGAPLPRARPAAVPIETSAKPQLGASSAAGPATEPATTKPAEAAATATKAEMVASPDKSASKTSAPKSEPSFPPVTPLE